MYPDGGGVCQKCHAHCDVIGCTGPGHHVGDGGCKGCDVALNVTVDWREERFECLPRGAHCDPGTFMKENLYKIEGDVWKKVRFAYCFPFDEAWWPSGLSRLLSKPASADFPSPVFQ